MRPDIAVIAVLVASAAPTAARAQALLSNPVTSLPSSSATTPGMPVPAVLI